MLFERGMDLPRDGSPLMEQVWAYVCRRHPSSRVSCLDRHCPGRLRGNNRAENSHLPVRRWERKMQRFKSQCQVQRFTSTHGTIYNVFNVQRHLTSLNTMQRSRSAAMAEWITAST